jgi:hypothetical protein
MTTRNISSDVWAQLVKLANAVGPCAANCGSYGCQLALAVLSVDRSETAIDPVSLLTAHEKELLHRQFSVEATKELRIRTGRPLKYCKELVDTYCATEEYRIGTMEKRRAP